jgi:hypothetical protein
VIYPNKNYLRNHAVLPNREQALLDFLDATLIRNGKQEKHKWLHSTNSNSEDALTWSCFDVLRCQPKQEIFKALDEVFEDAFGDFKTMPVPAAFSFAQEQNVEIHIGKNYYAKSVSEDTEVDASIETDSKLVFFEAKLYSKISLSDAVRPFDQLVRKLRVGLDVAHLENKEFYFIFLDIAPIDYLLQFGGKSVSAEYFNKYRKNARELEKNLVDIPYSTIEKVQTNMGWLPWACLFKTVLRTMITGVSTDGRQCIPEKV